MCHYLTILYLIQEDFLDQWVEKYLKLFQLKLIEAVRTNVHFCNSPMHNTQVKQENIARMIFLEEKLFKM